MNRQARTEEKLDRIDKTLRRSDGTVKIYGINKDGKLLTVVMEKTVNDKWEITEIAVGGRITGWFPVRRAA